MRCACGAWPDWADERKAENGVVCFECGCFECKDCAKPEALAAKDWDPEWCVACNDLGDAVALAASR